MARSDTPLATRCAKGHEFEPKMLTFTLLRFPCGCPLTSQTAREAEAVPVEQVVELLTFEQIGQ